MELPDNLSRVSSELLELFKEFTSFNGPGVFQSSNDLIQLSESGTSVLVRITAIDIERLLPALEDLGFEVLGSSPELHFVEGFISIISIPQLESLETQGLLGVVSIPRPETSKALITSQTVLVYEGNHESLTLLQPINKLAPSSSSIFSSTSFY